VHLVGIKEVIHFSCI